MNMYMAGFALFGFVVFLGMMYELIVDPYIEQKRKEEAAKESIRQVKLQRDADDLEMRLKEARERGAEMVAKDQGRKPAASTKYGAPYGQKTRTSRERVDVTEQLQVIADFNDDVPVRSSRQDDSWTSYDSGSSRRDTDSSWGSYSGGSSSSSYDSGSSSSSCSSSSCD